MIIFENPGRLDLLALTTMGLNAKPNTDNPIGYFGTGLKYAVAICARLGWKLTIQTGEVSAQDYWIETRKENFRGKEVQLIELHQFDKYPIQLPFTTELGKNWEPWTVLRELESNVRDEDGKSYFARELPQPRPGLVRFIVQSLAMDEIYRAKDKYFWNPSKEAHRTQFGMLSYENPGSIYYHGILTNKHPEMPFSFNVISQHTLTEDRTLSHTYFLGDEITDHIIYSEDIECVDKLITSPEGSFYNKALSNCKILNDKESFAHKRLDEMIETRAVRVDPGLLLNYKKKYKKESTYEEKEPNAREEAIITQIKEWFKERDMDLPDDMIWVCDMHSRLLGAVFDDRIYISRLAYEQGFETALATVIEEHAHWKHGYRDETRSFQDWLIRQWIMESFRC